MAKEFKEYMFRHPANVGVKGGKAYVIKKDNVSSDRKPRGAQKGHRGHSRPLPEFVDDYVKVPVHTCPHCGNDKLSKVQETRLRIIEGIVIPEPEINQYFIERRYCKCCKKLIETPVDVALPNARFDIRTMLFVTWLKIGTRMTVKGIVDLLHRGYGLTISEGEIPHILEQVAVAFEDYYEDLVNEIRNRPARNIDETSWPMFGKKHWLWGFITKWESVFYIHHSRGHQALLDVLGEEPSGVDIHDRWGAYDTYNKKSGNRPQQIDWVHIIRDTEELAKKHGTDCGNHVHYVAKLLFHEGKELKKRNLPPDELEREVEKLKELSKKALFRNYSNEDCNKFQKNLYDKHFEDLWTFITHPEVDPDNNAAERGVRHSVIARKISGGSRSERGAWRYYILLSVLKTLEKKGKELLTEGPRIIQTSHG